MLAQSRASGVKPYVVQWLVRTDACLSYTNSKVGRRLAGSSALQNPIQGYPSSGIPICPVCLSKILQAFIHIRGTPAGLLLCVRSNHKKERGPGQGLTSWSTDAKVVHFLYFTGSENRCKATSSYKADKELGFVLNEQTMYSWQRDEWTVGNNEQPALAKVSGREKAVAEQLTCGIVQLDHSSWDLQSRRSKNVTLLKAFK